MQGKNKRIAILLITGNEELKKQIPHITRAVKGSAEIWDKKGSRRLPQFTTGNYDVVIISAEQMDESDEEMLSHLREFSEINPRTQIILLIDETQVKLANKILRAGAYHYTKFPVDTEELIQLVESAFHDQPKLIEEERNPPEEKHNLGEIIGYSEKMKSIYKQIKQAALSDVPVLILGETGTGKDLVARTIHLMGRRANKPYLPVSLGALPSQLVASELFGHEKGAFTSAIRRHKGVFEQGSSGTVFLDEIDSMEEKIQISLLRLIEEKKFTRLGGSEEIHSRTRLIAASNEDLNELVEKGSFRMDLFYRLDVFRITIPPLRERPEDIPCLVNEFVMRYNKHYKKGIENIDPGVFISLQRFDWPGNVRELKNIIQRAVLTSVSKTFTPDMLPERIVKSAGHTPEAVFPIGTPLNIVEKEMIIRTLALTGNNRSKTAELLGISRRSLYSKIDRFGI